MAFSLAVLSVAYFGSANAFSKQSTSLFGGSFPNAINAIRQAPQDKRHDEQEGSTCQRMHLNEFVSSDEPHISRRQVFESARTIAAGYIGACATRSMLQPAHAISADEASKSYDAYAPTYDDLDGGSAAAALGIDAARSALLAKARGHVLEVGVGTGLNVNRYNFASGGDEGGVTALTLVDISEGMLNEARAKVVKLGLPPGVNVEFVRADATKDLAAKFGRDAFDTVVDTFSLCVMGTDGARDCLGQMREVVKAADRGGRILLIENTRSSNPVLGLYQDATAEKASQMGGKGCVYNQDVTAMLKNTKGLDVLREEAFAAGLFRSFEVVRKD